MATYSLTTTPTQIDDGASYTVLVTNTGAVEVDLSRGGRLRPNQSRTVYPEGTALTAAAVTGTGQVTTVATAAAQTQAQQVAANTSAVAGLPGTYAHPQGAWSSATAYSANAVVTYNGGTYRAAAASTNVTPGTDATKWESWGGGSVPSTFYPETYGAKADWRQVKDAAITSGTATLTSATATFTSGDVGRHVSVAAAGAAGIDHVTTISGFTNSTTVTLAANAAATVSGAYCDIATDDTTAVQAALDAACVANGRVLLQAKTYVVNSAPRTDRGTNSILATPTSFLFSVTVEGASPAENAESQFITSTPWTGASLSVIRTFRVSGTYSSDPPPTVLASSMIGGNVTLKNFAVVVPRDPRVCGVDFKNASRCELDGIAVVVDWRGTQAIDGNSCTAYWPFGIRMPAQSNFDKALVKSALVCGFWTGWIATAEHFTALDFVSHRCRIGIAWDGTGNGHAAVLTKMSCEYVTWLMAGWDPTGAVNGGYAPFMVGSYPFAIMLADLENTGGIYDPYNQLRGTLNFLRYASGGISRADFTTTATGGRGVRRTNLMNVGDGTIVPSDAVAITIMVDGVASGTNKPTLGTGATGFGSCLVFDGTGNTSTTVCAVDIGLPVGQRSTVWAPSGTQAFTVECRFKRSRTTTGEPLVSNWSSAAGGGRYELGISSADQIQAIVRGNSGTNYIVTGATTITDTNWHHAALSYDGTTLRVFLDGVSQGTPVSASSATSPNLTLNNYIGARPTGESAFAGSIDEVRLSNAARYTAGFTAPTVPHTSDANTHALYHCDALY